MTLRSRSTRAAIAFLAASLLLTLCLAGSALAQIPDPANSTCPTAVTVSSGGTACFDVIVRSFSGVPISGSIVQVDFGGCPISFCPSQPRSGNVVSATTNGSGVAHFCVCATLSSACAVTISAGGIQLCAPQALASCDAHVPMTMSYQGVLTDNGGAIVPNGAYNFSFSVYDDSSLAGAHLLWSEDHDDVNVQAGGFSVLLGMGTPAMPLALPFDKQYFLGISAAAAPGPPGSEMMPRVKLASSPYALMARSVADCAITSSSIAAGAVSGLHIASGAVSGGHIASGQVVKSLNGLRDAVNLVAGANVSITPSGQNLTISASGGGGGLSGSGSANSVAKFTGATSLGNSSIFDNGNVGIGTASPASKLDVVGTINSSVGFSVPNDLPGLGTVFSRPGYSRTRVISSSWTGATGDYIDIEVPGNDGAGNRLRITSRGNIGIGTTAPAAPLHIQGTQAWQRFVSTDTNNGSVIELWNTKAPIIDGPQITRGALNFGDGSTTAGQIVYVAQSGFGFRSGGLDNAMNINTLGWTGLGRSSVGNRLEVEGNASKTTAGSWLANSDARIKADVRTLEGALEKLDRVRLVDFRYTDDYRKAHPSVGDRKYVNVIAQEFAKAFPDDVKGSGEKLPNGEEILQVDTYPLTIYSAAAIQELHRLLQERDQEIERLRRDLAAQRESSGRVEARLSALERAAGRPMNAASASYQK